MGYRNDRQMLIVKLRALESELERLRGTNQEALRQELVAMRREVDEARTRARADEKKLSEVADRLERLHAGLGGVPMAPPTSGAWSLMALALALSGAVGAGLWVNGPCRRSAAWGCPRAHLSAGAQGAYTPAPIAASLPDGANQAVSTDAHASAGARPASDYVDFQVRFVDEPAGRGAGEQQSAEPMPSEDRDLSRRAPEERERRVAAGEIPSRSGVGDAFRAMAPSVRECMPAGDGVIYAAVTLHGPTGSVKDVYVNGVEGGSRDCVREVLFGLRVEQFERETFLVRYPFRY